MISVVLASVVISGTGCNVVVANRSYGGHQVYQAYHAPVKAAYVAPTYSYGHINATPYYSHAAFAYKVEDPEKSALYRQNEKLTDALVVELRESRLRADRLESSISVTGDPTGVAPPPEPARNQAASVAVLLKQNCMKCHSGDKAKGGFTLLPTPSVAQRLLINDVVNGKDASMPPKDQRQLTEAERQAIAEWAVVSREELKQASVTPAGPTK